MSVFAVWCPAAGDNPELAETFLVEDACEAAKAYVDQNAEVANGADVVRVLVQDLGRPDPTRTLAELRKRVGEPTTKIFAVDVLIEYEIKLSAKIAALSVGGDQTAAELDALHLVSMSGPRCPRTDNDGIACGGVAHLEGDGLVCGACGTEYGGTAEERSRARKADEAHVLWQRQHEPLRGLDP